MRIPLYWIDAFTNQPFQGNPAAVCCFESWPADELLLAMAREHGLSETAFLVERDGSFEIRWFTPAVEIELCGHATLASGFVVLEHLRPGLERVVFQSRSGPLTVARRGLRFELDFPSIPTLPWTPEPAAVQALGGAPTSWQRGSTKLLACFQNAAEVAALKPDFAGLARLPFQGVIATAPGVGVDFVSRYFAPAVGVPEDPVTGSAHCLLTPYWAERLGKRELHARQISARGGELWCSLRGARVGIAGGAVLYLSGAIDVDDLPRR